MPEWTEAQRDAITTTGRSILVSAAAGSGKTYVLAERCAYLVCDARCGIDELLVVTFTETAAAEMKGRIQKVLQERLEQKPADAHLRRQLALVEHANISTLHGFCARLLRRHFHAVGLDPEFQVIDADEAELLRNETVIGLFHQCYECDDSGDFHKLIDTYGDGNDQRLMDRVIHSQQLLCSLVHPAEWRKKAMDRLVEAAEKPLEHSDLGRELLDLIGEELEGLSDRCCKAIDEIGRMGSFPKYVRQLNELNQNIQSWRQTLASNGLDSAVDQFRQYKIPTLPGYPALPGKEIAQARINQIKDELKKGRIDELLRFDSRQWREGIASCLPQAGIFLKLIEDFSQRYQKAKAELHALDFNDLERFALQVLSDDPTAIKPSAAARICHDQFKHVLVDEYQDINEIQDCILNLVSRECVREYEKSTPNFFCVGDIKQSIFRFRLADPARFLNRQQQFRSSTSAGKVIDLQSNFRSRGPLLQAVNSIFQRLMVKGAGEIEYTPSHYLHSGANFGQHEVPCFNGSPIELHLLPEKMRGSEEDEDSEMTDLDKTEIEAMFVARRIRQLMGNDSCPRMNVLAKDANHKYHPRPINYGDIVILLRTMKVKSEQFADMLRKAGIPVYSEGGTGFFAATEIQDLLSLLRLLDNRQQDIPLVAVLRSPLAGFPDPENALARIRLAYQNGRDSIPFHQAAVRYAAEQQDDLAAKLQDFFARLEQWRRLAHQRPLAELIWTIYEQTGYLAFSSGLEDGRQRVANLISLHQRARQFGTFLRQGLYRFLQFMKELEEEKDLSRPSVTAGTENAVQIMSVHRSKGLEFPVVFLPDLGKRFNLEDCRGSILVDRTAGLAMEVVDEPRRIRYASLASLLAGEEIRRQTMAEELRLLYVALTRAKEHLVLVGSCGEDAMSKWQSTWANHDGPLPAHTVRDASTPLHWIGPVLASTCGCPSPPLHLTAHGADEISTWNQDITYRPKFTELQNRMVNLEPLPIPPTPNPQAQAVIRLLTSTYPHIESTRIPAAQSVSTWTKHGRPVPVGYEGSDATFAMQPELDVPQFLHAGKIKPSAAELGTLTHLVLQHVDFARPCDDGDLQAQINEMTSRKIIRIDEAALVDREAIGWFVATDLGRMIRAHAASLIRELPIYIANAETASPDPLDQQMIRGRIDLLIPADSGLILVDYKTDRVTTQTISARADFYQGQMDFYRKAIELITGKSVIGAYLVFLTPRAVMELQTGRRL